jgi:hypothetical protein
VKFTNPTGFDGYAVKTSEASALKTVKDVNPSGQSIQSPGLRICHPARVGMPELIDMPTMIPTPVFAGFNPMP